MRVPDPAPAGQASRRAGGAATSLVIRLAFAVVASSSAVPATSAGAPGHTFDPIAEVARHPRCMNCHTTTDWPRQGDDRRRHGVNVVRGPDGFGEAGLTCAGCHGESNLAAGGVPGAPHWHLAPLSMGWEYMSAGELCEQLQDPERNGDRSVEDIVTHMTEDPLVLWAWEPGLHPDGSEREPPPVALADWGPAVRAWADAGAPCPIDSGAEG